MIDSRCPVVIYHGNCDDGFAAAWAIWRKHPDWEFVAGRYGSPPPKLFGRKVYMVDFSYTGKDLHHTKKLLDGGNQLCVLDHHKTAAKDLEPLLADGTMSGRFDMELSGAIITWEWFHPESEIPPALWLIHDWDLWQFNYPDTRAFKFGLRTYPMQFELWEELLMSKERTRGMVMKGNAILDWYNMQIDAAKKKAFRMKFNDWDVPAVNAMPAFSSDLGHDLAQGEPFAVVFYEDGEKTTYQLRSAEDGVDVSEVARALGGGGHEHAAGFTRENFGTNMFFWGSDISVE